MNIHNVILILIKYLPWIQYTVNIPAVIFVIYNFLYNGFQASSCPFCNTFLCVPVANSGKKTLAPH